MAIKLINDATISGDLTVSGGDVKISGDTRDLVIENTVETKAGIVFVDAQATTTQAAAIKFDCSSETLDFFMNDESAERMSINTSGLLTITSGNILLQGTGRIQGVDTVSATTDAANKAYVDAHGGGLGPFLPLAGGTLTGSLNAQYAQFTSVNVEEDQKITLDIDGDQWNWIKSNSGQMEMAVGQTLKLINEEESIYGDIEVESLYSFINQTTAANATYVAVYTDSASSTVPRRQKPQTPAQFLSNAGGPFLPLTGGTMTGNIAFNTGGDALIQATGGDLKLQTVTDDIFLLSADDIGLTVNGSDVGVYISGGGGVDLRYNDVSTLQTISTGVNVDGQVTALTNKATPQYSFNGDTDTGVIQTGSLANYVGFMNGGQDTLNVAPTGKLQLNKYTAAAVTQVSAIDPNQNFQAGGQDTLAVLAVDPSGQVVRGSQEGTWTFTKAQLDALTTSTTSGTTLIKSPGTNKAIIVEESNLMLKYSGTGSMSTNSFVIRQGNNGDAAAEITRLPSGQINTIMSSAPTNPTYGFYSRDLPLYNGDGRSFVCDKATFLTRITANATPSNLISITIKLKYRLFDAATFD